MCPRWEKTFSTDFISGESCQGPGPGPPLLTNLDSLPPTLPADMTLLASPLANSQKAAPLTSAGQVDVKSEAALIPHSPGIAGRVNSHLHRRHQP